MRTVTFEFNEKDTVKIDNDTSIMGRVLSSSIRGNVITYQVGWMHNGGPIEVWIEEWRLTLWEE